MDLIFNLIITNKKLFIYTPAKHKAWSRDLNANSSVLCVSLFSCEKFLYKRKFLFKKIPTNEDNWISLICPKKSKNVNV